jgi:hypothetical protein
MTQDTQVIQNVVARFKQAAKDPRITAINRLMTKVKPAIAAYLSEKTEIPWQPSSYVNEKNMTFLSYTEHRVMAMGDRRQQWFLSFRFDPRGEDQSTPVYELIVTATKGDRILDSFRKEGVTLDDIRKVETIATPDMIKALNASFGGDYSKEVDGVKEYIDELLKDAEVATASIKQLAKIVGAGKLVDAVKSKALFEIESAGRSIQSGAQYVKSQLNTITEGK